MNFAACPDDGTHLKAAPHGPDPGRPLLLRCPVCLKLFKLTDRGIIEVPEGRSEQGPEPGPASSQ